MDKNVIYITDSSILNNAQEFSFYSIISLCGSYESIETFACHFNDIFRSLVLSKKSFSEWFKSEDNSDTLLHFLSNNKTAILFDFIFFYEKVLYL